MGHAGHDGCRRSKAPDCVIESVHKWLGAHPRIRSIALVLYYLAIIGTLLVMYGRGNFETPEFVYAEF